MASIEADKIGQGIETTIPLTLPFNGQIRDAVYPYIDYVKGVEDIIIDSWPLQRLRYILQLQTAHFVYPSATHTRFNHSIGVMHYSYKYLVQLLRNTRYSINNPKYLREISEHYRDLLIGVRILGLIHDIGHGPFSHAFDEYVLSRGDMLGYRIGNHEVLGYLIYREALREDIGKALRDHKGYLGVDPEYVLQVLDNGMKPPQGIEEYTDLIDKNVLSRDEVFAPIVEEVVVNVPRLIVRDYIYTSDIIDYLRRDSYFTGLPVGSINDEWIIRNTYLISYHNLLIPAITGKALDDLIRLLDARKRMYKSVYYHPVNIAFKETIGVLLECLREEIADVLDSMINGSDKMERYVELTDHSIYGYLQRMLSRPETIKCENRELAIHALKSLFIHRKPAWKRIYTYTCDLRRAQHLFTQRFGSRIREDVRRKIGEEVADLLKNKGFSIDDVRMSFNTIDIYPSASRVLFEKHLGNEMVILQVREYKPINWRVIELGEFLDRYGLVPEALFIIYLNRERYKALSEEDVKRVRELIDDILGDIIGEKISSTPPETS